MKNKFYKLNPPAEGDFGPDTIWNPGVMPQEFQFTHLLVDRWPYDIITRYPAFLVNEKLACILDSFKINGFEVRDCKVDKSLDYDPYRDVAGAAFPKFKELVIHGEPLHSDISVQDRSLIISSYCMSCISRFELSDCEITEV